MSGNIPQYFIDELLTAIDIVELIDGFVPLKKTGNSYSCCCPFHQEKTPSFHVIPHKQFFYCFGCGASGNSIKFMMQFSVVFRACNALTRIALNSVLGMLFIATNATPSSSTNAGRDASNAAAASIA